MKIHASHDTLPPYTPATGIYQPEANLTTRKATLLAHAPLVMILVSRAALGCTLFLNSLDSRAMTVTGKTSRILAVIGAVLLLAIMVLPKLLDADRYRAQAIAYLQESTGKQVEIGRLGVTLFPKVIIHVEKLAVKSPALFPPSDILQVERLDAEIDPWALLHRRISIRSLSLDQPIINLVSDPDGPWNFENPPSKNSTSSMPLGAITRVQMKRGHIIASNLLPSDAAGPVFFEAQDVFSELDEVNPQGIANPASTTLDGHGSLKAASLRFGSIEATNLSSDIRLQARQLFFTNAKADTYGGGTSGEFSVKLSGTSASFKSSAKMQRIDMARLLNSFQNARGKMTGRMEGDLEIAGQIKHSARPFEGLTGRGHLTVRNGQVPSLKLNANLMKLAHYNDLGPAKNDPSSFKMVSTDLELDHELLSSKAIDIDGYGVDLDGSGSVSLSGSDELNYEGIAQIVFEHGFVTNLIARMEGNVIKDGKLSFPFHLAGTIENPLFSKGK